MYCTNCGKENPDGVKFCCFCGTSALNAPTSPTSAETGQLDLEESAVSAPVSPVLDEPAVSPVLGEQTVPTAPVAPAAMASPNNFSAGSVPVPQPVVNRGYSPAPPVVNMTVPMKEKAPRKEKPAPVYKYSVKHILMCLISTAVCAIAAGIFAGLYFSVV